MAVKKLKPTSPGQRFRIVSDFSDITTSKPFKPLLRPLHKSSGRNNQGRITSWQKGNRHKRMYRLIDFKRLKKNIPCKVETIEYDPNRSANIALVVYNDGERKYILAPKTIKPGDVLISGDAVPIKIGNATLIKRLQVGQKIHCIELQPGKGAQIARTAGASATIFSNQENNKYVCIKLRSGEIRKILGTCYVVIGELAGESRKLIALGKAGASRRLGRRPHVRGTAKNPVDHPLGGGNGKGRGKQAVSRWGQLAKGLKTRNNKRTDKFIITTNRNKKKK